MSLKIRICKQGNPVVLILTTLLVWVYASSFSQEVLPIDAATVLEIAGAQNSTILELKEQESISRAKFTKSKDWWLPQLYAGIQAHQLTGAVMNGNGRFFIDVDRNNLWTGLGLDANWDLKKAIYTKKALNVSHEAVRHQTIAQTNVVLIKALEHYYDFMLAQSKVAALESLVGQTDTLASQFIIQVEAGLRYRSESLLVSSSLNLLKIELLNARRSLSLAQNALIRTLHLDLSTQLVSVDTTLLPIEPTVASYASIDSLVQRRPQWQQMSLQREVQEIYRRQHTLGMVLPAVRMQTYGAYFGAADGRVTAMQPELFPQTDQLYPTTNVNLSLMWNIPLGELIYKGDKKLYDAEVALASARLETFSDRASEEIAEARTMIETSGEQLSLAEEASKWTGEALTQSLQRQSLGTLIPLELLKAQEMFVRSRINYLEAVARYNLAQYQLKVAEGGVL